MWRASTSRVDIGRGESMAVAKSAEVVTKAMSGTHFPSTPAMA
jgi:hypothetical protein